MGAGLCFCVSFSAGDYATGHPTKDLWASCCRGVWTVGAGVGGLDLGPDEGFSVDVVGWVAFGYRAVLGDSQVAKALVVLVLDPNDGGCAVWGFYLADCG